MGGVSHLPLAQHVEVLLGLLGLLDFRDGAEVAPVADALFAVL